MSPSFNDVLPTLKTKWTFCHFAVNLFVFQNILLGDHVARQTTALLAPRVTTVFAVSTVWFETKQVLATGYRWSSSFFFVVCDCGQWWNVYPSVWPSGSVQNPWRPLSVGSYLWLCIMISGVGGWLQNPSNPPVCTGSWDWVEFGAGVKIQTNFISFLIFLLIRMKKPLK